VAPRQAGLFFATKPSRTRLRRCQSPGDALSVDGAARSSSNTADSRLPDSLTELAQQLDQFAKERDWQQFHSPRNLASALVVEVGDLHDNFQWMTEAQRHRGMRDMARPR